MFLAPNFLLTSSDTFAVGRIVQLQNAPKKTSRKNTNLSFLTQTIRRALVMLRFVIHWLRELWSITLEWARHARCRRCLHKLFPLNRYVRTSHSSTSNRNRLDSLPVYPLPYVVSSTIGYHSNSWAPCCVFVSSEYIFRSFSTSPKPICCHSRKRNRHEENPRTRL